MYISVIKRDSILLTTTQQMQEEATMAAGGAAPDIAAQVDVAKEDSAMAPGVVGVSTPVVVPDGGAAGTGLMFGDDEFSKFSTGHTGSFFLFFFFEHLICSGKVKIYIVIIFLS